MTLRFLDPYCEQLAAGRGRSSGAWSATGSTKKIEIRMKKSQAVRPVSGWKFFEDASESLS